MADLVGHVLDKLTQYMSSNDLKGDSAFKVPFAEGVAELVQHNNLTLKTLQKIVGGKDPFFVTNRISRKRFIEGLLPYLKDIIPISRRGIVDGFDEFFKKLYYQLPRDHYDMIWNDDVQDEEITRGLVHNSIVWFCDSKGSYVYREVKSGRGLIDIIVAEKVEVVVEVKNSGSYRPNVGIKQLTDYVNDRPDRRGYYILFDYTEEHKFSGLCDLGNGRYSRDRNPKMLVIQCARVKPSTQKY